MEGLDYAWGRPNLDEVVAAGYRFVVRYLCTYPACAGKVLTETELLDIEAHGLDLALVWEYDTHDALGGRTMGQHHAHQALTQAHSLGVPADVAIYFAVDFDATPAQLPTVADYFRGLADVLPLDRIGVYGGIRTVTYLHRAGLASWVWQTYAWSNGQVYDGTHVHQYSNGHMVAGADCDLNTAKVPSFGQWKAGDSMGFEPDDQARLIATDNRVRETLLKGSEVYDDVPGEGEGQKPWIVQRVNAIYDDVADIRRQLAGGVPVALSRADLETLADIAVELLARAVLDRGGTPATLHAPATAAPTPDHP